MIRPHLPRAVNLAMIAAGALLIGGRAAFTVAPSPEQVVGPGSTLTETRTDTEILTRKVKGRIIRLANGERVVHVPLIVVHTDTKTIRIPPHNLPIHPITGLSAAFKAAPPGPVTVTVYQPVTVYPDPVTVTVTETGPVSTVTDTLTVTVSLPIDPPATDDHPTTSDPWRTDPCEGTSTCR